MIFILKWGTFDFPLCQNKIEINIVPLWEEKNEFYFLLLGEDPNSYGYGGTGKFSVNCKFQNYGEPFGVGDVIGTLLDFDARGPSISYTKNGKWLGLATPLKGFTPGQKDMALFPHVLSKNCR